MSLEAQSQLNELKFLKWYFKKYKLLLIGQLSYTNSDTEHYMVQLGERYPIIKE